MARVLQVHLVVAQIDRAEGFQVGTVQQQPRVPGNHVCHKANYLTSQIPLQSYCPLQMPSAAVKSLELRWAHVGKPTWLSSTDFHMVLKNTVSNQCFRTTRVLYRTPWAVAHSDWSHSSAPLCSSFRRFHRSSCSSFSKCYLWAERTSAIAGNSRSHVVLGRVSLDSFV